MWTACLEHCVLSSDVVGTRGLQCTRLQTVSPEPVEGFLLLLARLLRCVLAMPSYVDSVHAGIQAMPCTKKYMYIYRSIVRMRCLQAAPRKPVEPAGFVPPASRSYIIEQG